MKITLSKFKKGLIIATGIFTIIQASAQDVTYPDVAEANPASGSKVESLSEIILTMNQETIDAAEEWLLESVPLPQIFGANTDVEATLWYPQGDLKQLKITIEPTITADGTYEITIPAGYISNNNSEFNQEIKLVYTIGTGSSGEEPVQYDLNYTSITPMPGIYESLETITLTFDEEIFTNPENSYAYLYQTSNGMLYKRVPIEVRDGNNADILFKDFDIAGSYELVIDKATIGDAKWNESHHLGHSNNEYTFNYTVKRSESKLIYDYIPEFIPDGSEALTELDKITLKFNGPWCAASDKDIVILNDLEDEYPATVSLGNSLSEAVLSLASPISTPGQYKIIIPEGRFGNSDYEETSGAEGNLNPEITKTFTVSGNAAVNAVVNSDLSIKPGVNQLTVEGNGLVTIYTPQGLLVTSASIDGTATIKLEPGLYLVKTASSTAKIVII